MSALLGEKMGFNGLIATDSTLMVGFMQCSQEERRPPIQLNAVPM